VKRLCTLACAFCAIVAPGTSAAAAPPAIGAYPALYPAFSPEVTDYVSRCRHGRPLLLAIHAPAAPAVTIGRRRPVTGSLQARLRLGAGQGVPVRIESAGRTATYHVRCLPKSFPRFTAERHGTPQAQWYIVTPTVGGSDGKGSRFVAIFDAHGAPVWWMRPPYNPQDAKLLPDGNLAWSAFTFTPYVTRSAPYEEHRLDGSLVRKIEAVGVETDSHEMQVLPDGDYLLVSYVLRDGVDLSPYGGPADATVVDSEVQEVSPSGKLVWSWNSKDHVAVSESAPFMKAILLQPRVIADGRTVYDITHVNSVEPDGDSLLISLRHTDGVYKVNRASGAVEWKLGGTRTPESLSVDGEPSDSLVISGQHDARLLPDGTLTLHDNRTGSTTLGPRAVRYRIDAAARTATQLEEITDPDAVLSVCCGSARRLPGGNWVMSWGYSGLVTELTPSGQRVFGLRFGDGLFSYRAVPLVAGDLSARKLREGMDAMHPRSTG
jgi:Arylsulfotransferase (ASST)